MDLEQLAKTTQWLDEERRKDRKDLTAVQERLNAVTTERDTLQRRVQQLESDLATLAATVHKVAKIDDILAAHRKEMSRQLEELEQRRAEADQESDRLRKVERDGLNKSLAELRRGLDPLTRLEREAQTRKDEENRLARLVAEIQQKVTDFNRYVDERLRMVTVVEEGRRQDAKRIGDLQTEQAELRRRADDLRGKIEIIEDLARRLDVRVGEIFSAESERRTLLSQWLDAQSIAQAERDRAWNDSQARVENMERAVEDHMRRVEQFAEANREIKQAAENFRRMAEALERRVTEAAEIQRLGDERLRQDWAAFLADDQKRWTTHMLLRDEQWREHDRARNRQLERLESLEEHVSEALDRLRHLQELDASRLQAILALVRDLAAEHDPNFAKAR